MKNNYWENLIESLEVEREHKFWVKVSNWLIVLAGATLLAYSLTTLF